MSLAKIAELLGGGLGEGYSALYIESLLKVGFGCNGPRTSQTACRLRWCGSHPIRRRGAHRAIFSAHRIAGFVLAAHPLRSNGVFHYLAGLPGYPQASSLRRFLERFARSGRN